MRKVFLISILLLPSLAFSRIEQIETAFYADGYWSEWEPWILPPVLLNITIRDNEVSNRREERYHPSDYNWRFIMSKRIKKNDNGWAVYSGTFEHYGNNLKKFFKGGQLDFWCLRDPVRHSTESHESLPKTIVEATIRMQKHNIHTIYGKGIKHTYNILTNEGGFAISFIVY